MCSDFCLIPSTSWWLPPPAPPSYQVQCWRFPKHCWVQLRSSHALQGWAALYPLVLPLNHLYGWSRISESAPRLSEYHWVGSPPLSLWSLGFECWRAVPNMEVKKSLRVTLILVQKSFILRAWIHAEFTFWLCKIYEYNSFSKWILRGKEIG